MQERQQVLDALHHVQGRGRAVLEDGGEHRAAAIDMHDVALGRAAVAHMRHVAHEDGGAVGRGLDRQVVQALDGVRGVVELDHILIGADLDVAGGHDLVLAGDGVLHIGGRNLCACMAWGSRSICTSRNLPP